MGAQEELYWHVAITLSVCEFQSAAAKADKMASKESEAVPWVNIYSSWSASVKDPSILQCIVSICVPSCYHKHQCLQNHNKHAGFIQVM